MNRRIFCLLNSLIFVAMAVGAVVAGNLPVKPACVGICSDLCSQECAAGMGYSFGPKGLSEAKPTAAQVKILQKLHSEFVQKTKTPRARIQERMRKLSSLWSSGKGDPSSVKKLIDGIETDRVVMRNLAVDYSFKAMNALSQKQRARLQSSVINGYVHLLSIGTRMSGGSNTLSARARAVPDCATGCKAPTPRGSKPASAKK